VRQLRNAITRLAVLSRSEIVDVEELTELLENEVPVPSNKTLDRVVRTLLATDLGSANKLQLLEEHAVRIALEMAGGNKSAAARLLGVERKALERRSTKHSLDGDLDP
jgi:DNA-binding NtrC family response regulator